MYKKLIALSALMALIACIPQNDKKNDQNNNQQTNEQADSQLKAKSWWDQDDRDQKNGNMKNNNGMQNGNDMQNNNGMQNNNNMPRQNGMQNSRDAYNGNNSQNHNGMQNGNGMRNGNNMQNNNGMHNPSNNGGWKTQAMNGNGKTIVQTAMANRDLATLVAALKAAGLDQTLAGKGPFTVFAPTDRAFDQMPRDRLQELLKPENRNELKKLLMYHVVAGKLSNAEIGKMRALRSVEGQSLNVRVSGGKLYVDDAEVSDQEIVTDNGIIHPINQVLMPQ